MKIILCYLPVTVFVHSFSFSFLKWFIIYQIKINVNNQIRFSVTEREELKSKVSTIGDGTYEKWEKRKIQEYKKEKESYSNTRGV